MPSARAAASLSGEREVPKGRAPMARASWTAASPTPLADAVSGWTGGRGVDVVLDLVGGDYLPASLEMLATRGRLMLVGSLAGRSATVDLSTLLRRRLTVRGTVLRARPLEEKIMVARHFAAHVVPLLAAGTVHPVVDAVFPLEAAAEAYARLASNRTVGKVVLSMD